jgi:hypothetical protein
VTTSPDSTIDGPVGPPVFRVLSGTLIGLLACLSTLQVALALAMVGNPAELMYGEAILYAHAHRLLDGAELYQAIDRLPYTVASYTPLFYVATAFLQACMGPGFGPGRGLALVCLGACGVLVGVLGACDGRGVRAGLLAGLLFVALGAPGSGPVPWTALYKEDGLALGLALAGLVVVSRSSRSSPGAVVAGLLCALAILTKQTYAPMALAPAGWLWFHARRASIVFLMAVLLPIAGAAAWLQISTGAFFDSVVLSNVNPVSQPLLVANLQLLLLFQVGPLLAACLYAAGTRTRRFRTDGLLLCAWAGAAVQLLALAKVGGGSNHWLAFAAITAVLASHGVYPGKGHNRLRADAPRRLAVVAVFGGVLLVAPVAAGAWLATLSASQAWMAANAGEFPAIVERVRANRGEVLAEPLDVVALASRQPLFEPLLLGLFAETGSWDVGAIVRKICDGSVSLVVVDRPIESVVDWPAPVRAAVAQSMQLQGTWAGRLVYVPGSGSGAACVG